MFFNKKISFLDLGIILLLKRFLYALLIATCCRLFFCLYYYNTFTFETVDLFLVLINGLRFDAASLNLLLVPFFLFQLWPLNSFQAKLEKSLKIYWIVIVCLFVLVNLIDTAYFTFSGKRSNADFFMLNSTGGGDLLNQIPKYVLEYWFWWILFFIFSIVIWKKYPTGYGYHNEVEKSTIAKKISISIVSIALIFIAIRGGIQGRPIKSIAASEFVNPKFSAAVLNTAFTILTTIGEENIETPNYFLKSEEEKIWPMLHHESKFKFVKKNIVIIVVESLGKEWMGYFGAEKTATPFLDSLCDKSFVCTNAYANAQRSIEGIPAIFSSTPGLTEVAFVTSSYGGNTNLTSLANTLESYNYHSAFFHGGNNGTMAFDWYFKRINFKEYYGRKEFANPKIFDGFWGVPDYEFLEFLI